MVEELEKLILLFCGNEVRARCFVHVLNLVAKVMYCQCLRLTFNWLVILQAILSPFACPAKDDGDVAGLKAVVNDPNPDDYQSDLEDEDKDDRIAPEVEAFDAETMRDMIKEVGLAGRLELLSDEDLKEAKLAVTKVCLVDLPYCAHHWLAVKVCKLLTKCHWNRAVSDDLKVACVECELQAKKLVKDVTTQWNSTTNTIHRAVELHAPIEIVAVKLAYNKPCGIQLKRWLPSPGEWGLLEALIPVLDVSESLCPCAHI
jgi:hypothetical protein